MKKIYTIIVLLAISSSMTFAQSSKTQKADKLYEQLKYTDAADAYLNVLQKGENTPYVYERLGNSFYYINDTKKAETYYNRIMKRKDVDAETVYNYAQSLKANGKTSDYNTYMRKFAEMKPGDTRAIAFMKDPDYLPKIADESRQMFTASNLEHLNSKFSDFGGRVYGGELYFTSARNTSRKTYDWNNEPFLDIYIGQIVGGVEKEAELMKGPINTKYHESTVAITSDGKRIYFDRNDFLDGKFKRGDDGINQLNIYYAEFIAGEWKDVKPVPFNMENYSTGHPALSSDGNTLYFTSDRPGGKGQADIYSVSIDKDGNFGTPKNLTEINTEGKELFPFADSNGTLYFSSDGHPGMGGLDVFSAEPRGNGYGEVKNLGLGVNSPQDDFAFYYDPASGEGYVSSNRPGGKGSDDIYKITEIEHCELIVNVTVIDATTKALIPGARLDLFDNKQNKLKSETTNANGAGKLIAACDQEHVVQAFKEGYEAGAEPVASTKGGEKTIQIELRPIEDIIVEGKVVLDPIHFDYDKHNIKPQAAFELDKVVELMNKRPTMVIKIESHTDSRGTNTYNQGLSERRAQSTMEYIISRGISKDRLSAEGFGASKPIHNCGADCSEKQHEANRRSEFIIVSE